MTEQRIAQAAALLVDARRSMKPLAGLPAACCPETVAEAHAVQDAVTALLGKPVGAYKAMAPANGEANRGVIYAETVVASPSRMPAALVPNCGVEGEVAFIFRTALPPRAAPYTRDEVAAAVDAVAAIEVVHSRYTDHNKASNMEKMADCISNGALVHSAAMPGWQKLDLGKIHVRLTVNGATVLEKDGGHPLGDPLAVAVVLANMMRGTIGVSAGQMVTCGSYTGLMFLKPGDVCGVTFEGLGSAEVTFVA